MWEREGKGQRGQVHLLTRGVGRRQLFENEADYDAFERIITGDFEQLSDAHLRLLLDAQSLAFRHVARNVVGEGYLYQGRFKSFPVGKLNGPVPFLFPAGRQQHRRGVNVDDRLQVLAIAAAADDRYRRRGSGGERQDHPVALQ